jgi:hypothetical protein
MYYIILNKVVVKNVNSVLWQSCPYCDSTLLEDDVVAVKCLDCGMGKYKEGRHKTYRKQLQEYPHIV